MVAVSVRYLFYQLIDEKIKTWTLRSSAKENPNMEKVLFDWPIVLQYDVKAEYWLISRRFSGMKFFHPSVNSLNQPKATRVCKRSINQSNRSISVRFLFRFVRAFSFQGHRKIVLSWDGWQIRWISSDLIMSTYFIFQGTHRNSSAKMAVNMAAGLTPERIKNHTQLSYMYVLPLLRKF